MQSGEVEQQHGIGVSGDMLADLVDVTLHRDGVGERQRQCRAHTPDGADGAEQVGALVALVGGLDRPRVPRRAHSRTRPFFWPMRASSWNQISIFFLRVKPAR